MLGNNKVTVFCSKLMLVRYLVTIHFTSPPQLVQTMNTSAQTDVSLCPGAVMVRKIVRMGMMKGTAVSVMSLDNIVV